MCELSSLMALSAVRLAGRTGQFYWEGLLDHYERTLGEIRAKGFFASWREEFRPYLKAAASPFSPRRQTLTGWWLGGGGARRSNGRLVVLSFGSQLTGQRVQG